MMTAIGLGCLLLASAIAIVLAYTRGRIDERDRNKWYWWSEL